MSLIRDEIVRIARAEATPAPHGKVSDLVRDGEGRRAGWQHLKKYFDDAVAGWSESKWSDRGSIKIGEQAVKLTNLEGIQKPGLRVIQGASKPSGVSWCGIFATWVWRQAGLKAVVWHQGLGPRGNGVTIVNKTTGFQRGDIIVIRSGEVHHAIVAEMPSVYDVDTEGNPDKTIVTVNGNSTYQSIRVHSEYRLQDVAYYYTFPD